MKDNINMEGKSASVDALHIQKHIPANQTTLIKGKIFVFVLEQQSVYYEYSVTLLLHCPC
jgi:hypothetical protein